MPAAYLLHFRPGLCSMLRKEWYCTKRRPPIGSEACRGCTAVALHMPSACLLAAGPLLPAALQLSYP